MKEKLKAELVRLILTQIERGQDLDTPSVALNIVEMLDDGDWLHEEVSLWEAYMDGVISR
jgi:hypothetical protein